MRESDVSSNAQLCFHAIFCLAYNLTGCEIAIPALLIVRDNSFRVCNWKAGMIAHEHVNHFPLTRAANYHATVSKSMSKSRIYGEMMICRQKVIIRQQNF